MRRLSNASRDDSGVTTIIVVIAMTAMLVGAAFAIDVGGYVVAARSAQNSADATVLAVANDCARTGAPILDYSPYHKPEQTISTPVCGAGEATITVTKEVDGLLLNQSAGSVNRRATARWGTLRVANTAPFTIADCEFATAVPSWDRPADNVTLYLDDPPPGTGCSSPAGGFGQLLDDRCVVTVSANSLVPGKPGNDLNQRSFVPCITNTTGPDPLPHDVLIPIYDTVKCELSNCKGGGSYEVRGFALFTITGYSLIGNFYGGTLDRNCPAGGNQARCIRGNFKRFLYPGGTPGPSTNFGVTQVYLYS